MRFSMFAMFAAAVALAASGCSSSSQPRVNMKEATRVVGTDNDVRVDAQLYADQINSSTPIGIVYQIQNDRKEAIAIAANQTDASFDRQSQTITVNIGAEIPGSKGVPRLTLIEPGQKKGFSVGVRIAVAVPTGSRLAPTPRYLRIRVNFLNDAEPFQGVISASNQNVEPVSLPKGLFTRWIDCNESVETNTIPVYWSTAPAIANFGGVPAAGSY
ncbi:MAG: hypothetical protein WBX15_09015 [Thermoanaerobaculia bacterium]